MKAIKNCYKFSDDKPMPGTNVICFNEQELMAFVQWSKEAQKHISSTDDSNYYGVSCFNNFINDDSEYDLKSFPYWTYPQNIPSVFLGKNNGR